MYPDGVLFSLIDKRDVAYNDGNGGNSTSMSLSELSYRLPKKIVGNREVRNVNTEIRRSFDKKLADNRSGSGNNNGMKAKFTWVRTSIDSSIDEKGKVQDVEVDNNLICEVQIRWLDGSNLYVRMHRTELVSDLKRVLYFVQSSQNIYFHEFFKPYDLFALVFETSL